jgi:LPXTG-site transpeptidase (sortase) family protein
MTKSEIIRFLILRTVGNFLLLFALFGVFATFGPILYYEASYRIIKFEGIEYKAPEINPPAGGVEKTSTLGKLLEKQNPGKTVIEGGGLNGIFASAKEQILIPKDTEFGILIPKIGANAKVFPNVDSSSQNNFLPILQHGVAHAKGTVFPGMPGNIYLFAHSTDNFWNVGRYNAIFYLLKNLSAGDEIVVYYQNRRFDYRVLETRVVDASDVSYITNSQALGQETLVLQTCWPPGTTWKRFLVIAKPK